MNLIWFDVIMKSCIIKVDCYIVYNEYLSGKPKARIFLIIAKPTNSDISHFKWMVVLALKSTNFKLNIAKI